MCAEIRERLDRRLREEYPETGPAAAENVRRWLERRVPFVPERELGDFLAHAPLDLIHESFWRNLPFGTGGVRGTVGFGPNRINTTVVALTVQAHCCYLGDFFAAGRGTGLEKSVVIANDVRKFCDISGSLKFLQHNPYHADRGNPPHRISSRRLAYLAAGVYARNGYLVYMLRPGDDDAFLTTPELSFLIRHLHAAGGINLSASHNPPDDNGVKVYDEKGGQYLPPDDQDLTNRTREIHEAAHMPYSEAVAAGLVKDVPREALAAYMALYVDRARDRGLTAQRATPILFTPLSGCGERTVRAGLEKLGYVVSVPDREKPDGTFSSIPLRIANPEVPESTRNSKIEAGASGATLVLASDPDADRLGAEVYHQGSWRHLTGNQIGAILAFYLLLDPDGPQLRGGVYTTVVTTLAIPEIARRAGCQPVVSDLLIGFKYIGGSVFEHQREAPGASDLDLLAFAAEESHGYLDTPRLRDKDAMSGALYLAKLHERLTGSGGTLVDYLHTVYEAVGEFGDIGRSVIIRGSAGVRAIQGMMMELRVEPLSSLGGMPVGEIIDRRDPAFGEKKSETDWEARNLLIYTFEYGQVSLRPSGTEPKLKFYVQTRGAPPGQRPQEYAELVAGQVYRELLGRLETVYRKYLKVADPGLVLTEWFASLPDVIPLQGKIALERDVAPALRARVTAGDYQVGLVAGWLAERLGSLVPGEAAWEVAEPALRGAAGEWGGPESERVDTVFGYLRRQGVGAG